MRKQLLPISVSLSFFIIFSYLTYFILKYINTLNAVEEKILITIIYEQVVLGMFIYLKTAVDYAIFVGRLMDKNQGIKKRLAMNIGTSLGCFFGVSLILIIWSIFKEVKIIMFILLLFSGMILIGLGDNSQEHFHDMNKNFKTPVQVFFNITRPIVNMFTFFMPEGSMKAKTLDLKSLFIYSAILPFILGADDLAGYMVLMSISNVFSLLIGIYLADAVIDIFLFTNRKLTTKFVKNKFISYFGAIFFIIIGVLSIIKAINIYL